MNLNGEWGKASGIAKKSKKCFYFELLLGCDSICVYLLAPQSINHSMMRKSEKTSSHECLTGEWFIYATSFFFLPKKLRWTISHRNRFFGIKIFNKYSPFSFSDKLRAHRTVLKFWNGIFFTQWYCFTTNTRMKFDRSAKSRPSVTNTMQYRRMTWKTAKYWKPFRLLFDVVAYGMWAVCTRSYAVNRWTTATRQINRNHKNE